MHPRAYKTFTVEHYFPKKPFPELECDYENLFFVCPDCNSYKSDYWQKDEDEPYVPNPCDHVMMEHVRFVECEVKARSVHGAFLIETLLLNEQALVEYRKGHEWTIRAIETEIEKLNRSKKQLQKKIARASGSINATAELAAIDAELTQQFKNLDRFCGTTLKSAPKGCRERS